MVNGVIVYLYSSNMLGIEKLLSLLVIVKLGICSSSNRVSRFIPVMHMCMQLAMAKVTIVVSR